MVETAVSHRRSTNGAKGRGKAQPRRQGTPSVVSCEVHARAAAPRQDGLMEHGPHPGFLIAIGTWTAIQLVTIAVGAYLMLRERRRTQSG